MGYEWDEGEKNLKRTPHNASIIILLEVCEVRKIRIRISINSIRIRVSNLSWFLFESNFGGKKWEKGIVYINFYSIKDPLKSLFLKLLNYLMKVVL